MPAPKDFSELLNNFKVEWWDFTLRNIRIAICDLLQRFKSEEERKLEETRKHGTLFLDYTPKECEIYMYAYVLSRIDDLGRGIIVDIKSKGDPKKSGSSGRHMGSSIDELLIEK